MARSLASSIAATLTLLVGSNAMAADLVQPAVPATAASSPADYVDASAYEIPATPFRDATALGGEILHGTEVDEAEWRVELYSDFVFTQAAIDKDSALPNNSPSKKFLAQLFPWEKKHRCGAVYIGDMWVLTAAHCVYEVPPPSLVSVWRVRVAATDLQLNAGTSFKVVRVIHNAKYVGIGNEKGNDIALIRIEADASTDAGVAENLKSIRILGDTAGDPPLADNAPVEVSGWGTTHVRAPNTPPLIQPGNALMHGSPTLKQVTVKKLPISVCMADAAYKELINKARDPSKAGDPVICVGPGAPQTDACQGDSGGPLTRKIGNQTVLVGLVSLGKGCGTGTPSIYTNVTYFLDWINQAKLEPARQVSRW